MFRITANTTALDSLAKALAQPRAITTIAAKIAAEALRQNLETGREGASRQPFKALRPATVTQKRRKRYRRPEAPLIGSYRLHDSVLPRLLGDKTAVEAEHYGSYHLVPTKNRPARDWASLSPSAEEQIARSIINYLGG